MTTRNAANLRSGSIARWLLGFVAAATVAGLAQAQPAVSNPFNYGVTTSYAFRSDGVYSGQLSTTTTMSNVLASCTLMTVDYDTHGNNVSTKLENCAGAPAGAAFSTRTATSGYYAVASQPITVAGGTVLVSLPAGLAQTSATNVAGQATTTEFDPRFGAPLQQTDINGQTSYQVLDDFGRVVVHKLPDGTSLATRYCILAAMGLDLGSNSPGCATPAASEAPADAVMFTESQRTDAGGHFMGAWTRNYTDRLGRGVRVVTQGYDGPVQGASSGRLVAADTVYGLVGQVILTSDPHFLFNGSASTAGSNDVRVTSYDYDALARTVTVAVSDQAGHGGGVDFSRNGQTGYGQLTAAVSRLSYSGLSTTMTNDFGQQRVEERDPFKQLVRVTDADGAQLSTLYDAFSHVVKTQDALGNVTSYVYDAKGDTLQRDDPDKGLTTYTYDALGQVISSQNANEAVWGTRTTLAYDVLGRVTSRIASEYQSTWTYDACANGVGALCSVSSTNQIRKDYTYDTRGRLSIKRVSSPSLSLPESFSYDPVSGRLSTRTYPTGLQVKLNYTALGYNSELRLVTPASVSPLPHTVGGAAGSSGSLAADSVLWSNDVVNAAGASERQSFGNGVVTTTGYEPFSARLSTRSANGATGLVTSQSYSWNSLNDLVGRSESAPGPNALSETFSYGDPAHGDNLQRLSGYTVAHPDMPGLSRTVSLGYNALGELLFKSDVGNYAYGASGSTHPHALQTVAGATNDAFAYDARGNVTGGGNGRFSSIKYTSFDLPDATQGITGTPGQPRYTWQYDEGHARVTQTRRVLSTDGVHDDVRTTWYDNPDNAGGLSFEYETDQPAGAATVMRNVSESRHFLSAGGQTIGVLISEGVLGSTATTPPVVSSIALTKVEFWNQDHLGSIVATTDRTGAVTARYSYDPFGKRRANNGAYDAAGTVVADWSTLVDSGTARGFTGHEHLDDIGLIQMNGRIFEPTLGVFLQGDTSVPHPEDLQSFHRYAYCRNNPMGCSDPTGFEDGAPLPPQDVTVQASVPRGAFTSTVTSFGAAVQAQLRQALSRSKEDHVGTHIARPTELTHSELLAIAGAIQAVNGKLVLPGLKDPISVDDFVRRFGTANVQALLQVLNSAQDAKDPLGGTSVPLQAIRNRGGEIIAVNTPAGRALSYDVGEGSALLGSVGITGYLSTFVAGRMVIATFGITADIQAGSDGLPTGGSSAAAEAQTLFRGVASDSPAFANAQLGIAVPRGGMASTLEHSLGNWESNYTSWTTDYSTAASFATNRGTTSGVIMTASFPRGFAIPAAPSIEQIMMESEHLVPSRVTGATVTRVH